MEHFVMIQVREMELTAAMSSVEKGLILDIKDTTSECENKEKVKGPSNWLVPFT